MIEERKKFNLMNESEQLNHIKEKCKIYSNKENLGIYLTNLLWNGNPDDLHILELTNVKNCLDGLKNLHYNLKNFMTALTIRRADMGMTESFIHKIGVLDTLQAFNFDHLIEVNLTRKETPAQCLEELKKIINTMGSITLLAISNYRDTVSKTFFDFSTINSNEAAFYAEYEDLKKALIDEYKVIKEILSQQIIPDHV